MPIRVVPGQVQQTLAEVIDRWQSLGVTWTSGRTTIDLATGDSGIVITPDGVKGLNMPKFDRYTTDAPSLPGARYRGSRTQERNVFWPVLVFGATSQEFLDRDRQLWSVLRPDQVGTWQITTRDGGVRSLDCRFVDDADTAYTLDPSQAGWAVYGVNLVADDLPYWYGPDVVRTFSPPADEPFFLTSGGVFHIASGQSTASAYIPNPGDVTAWPVWSVSGAVAGATLGVAGGSVTLPAIGANDAWVVDTRPDRMTAVDGSGTDRSGDVVWNPAPIAPGSEVELTINLTSPSVTAGVTCSLTPLYFRAW